MKERRNGKAKASGSNRGGRKPSGGRKKGTREVRARQGAEHVGGTQVGVADAKGLGKGKRAKGKRVAKPKSVKPTRGRSGRKPIGDKPKKVVPSGSKLVTGWTSFFFMRFASREERELLDRVSAHYGMPKVKLLIALLSEADKLIEVGKSLTGVKRAAKRTAKRSKNPDKAAAEEKFAKDVAPVTEPVEKVA